MTSEPSFESLPYKPNAELDRDVSFFQSVSSLDTKYFNIDDT